MKPKPIASKKGAGTTGARAESMPTKHTPEPSTALSDLPESTRAALDTYRKGVARGIEEWLQENELPADLELKLKRALDHANEKGLHFLKFPPSSLDSFVTSAFKEPLVGGSR